ncbi:MAG: hypothetical protein ACFCUE_00200 [Candidatus Bathyarchaeia archaeon]|jgi:hypothetical protein
MPRKNISRFTAIIGHHKNQTAYITWAQRYNKLAKDRALDLPFDKQVKVFSEFYSCPCQKLLSDNIEGTFAYL